MPCVNFQVVAAVATAAQAAATTDARVCRPDLIAGGSGAVEIAIRGVISLGSVRPARTHPLTPCLLHPLSGRGCDQHSDGNSLLNFA